MARHGKRVLDARKAVRQGGARALPEALAAVKEAASAKFDETVEIAIRLGIDPRRSDQAVRGTCKLPAGTGKDIRVAVFARGDKADEAGKAGADIVGAEELVERVQKGEIGFERCIATPDMMGLVGRVARVLGPRGLMPNPKVGTVTQDVATAVANAKQGEIPFRAERTGIVHAGIGRASFAVDALADNARALVAAVNRARPSAAKGTYLKKISLSSTMGPGVRVEVASVAG